MAAEIAVIGKKPTSKEVEYLNQLSKPGAKIEVLVPKEIDAKEWKFAVSVVCKGLRRAQIQEQALMPVLGRLLVIARENQEIWKGYDTFSNYMEGEIYNAFGVKRSTCYDAMTIAERFPDLDMEDYTKISRRNFKLLAKSIPVGDESKRNSKELIEKAKEMSDSQFTEHCVEKGYIDGGHEMVGTFIRIPTNKKVEAIWNKFIEDPRVHAVVGTSRPGAILERMIEECKGEWLARADEVEAAAGERATA